MQTFTKSLLTIIILIASSAAVTAQDSVSVTFRYYAPGNVVRVMLPGEFNNFGPNSDGVISPTSQSLMSYDAIRDMWFKTLRLELDGGASTFQGANGYRYKFHEHLNSSGTQNNWIADPFNRDIADQGLGDSWVEITSPMIFQMEPVNNSVFQQEFPVLAATVASLDSDSIDQVASEILINDVVVSNFQGHYDEVLQLVYIDDFPSLGVTLEDGSNEFKIRAVTAGGVVRMDSTSFSYVGVSETVLQPRPAGLKDGITYSPTDAGTVQLSLYAPYKQSVFVIGDFNNWTIDPDYQMKKDSTAPDSVWFWTEINGLTPGQEYGFQYLVDNSIRIADPYSELVLDPFNDQFIPESVYPNMKAYPEGVTTEYVGVLQPGRAEYEWQSDDYIRPASDELIIYELLIRDFFDEPSYTNLIDSLDYLETLGINAIELMPVNEFDGNISWGYNPSFHFALDKYYGPQDEFKRFVDEAHKRGIAVILDVVLNHTFGQNPLVRLWNDDNYGAPTDQNPFFNRVARHPFNVGYDMDHENPKTREYSKRVMQYWIEEYRVDGYRFDLSKGFTQVNSGDNVGLWGNYDQSRVNIWLDYAGFMRSVDPDTYIILEHFADGSEEQALSNNGMLLWGNMNHEYNEATMGYTSNLNDVLAQFRNFNDRNLIGYMESHDEQWLMMKNIQFGNSNPDLQYNIRQFPTALDRMELAGAFFFTLPGPKMMWQFGELGYGYGDSGEQCLREASYCDEVPTPSVGRTDPKPIRWDYYEDPDRKDLYDAWSAMINLRRSSPAFSRPSSTFYDLQGTVKYVRLRHPDTDVVIIGNFSVNNTNQTFDFPVDGTWYDFFGESEITVSGGQHSFDMVPGEYRIFTTRQFTIGTSSENEWTGDDPVSFKLHQNYPNPFNPSTNIMFDVPETGLVKLEVFDITGRKVADLVNGVRTQGSHTVSFDASDLSSGIYFARFTAAGSVQTQKMMLLK